VKERGERRRDATWSLVEGVAADEMYDMDGPRRKGAVRRMGGTRTRFCSMGICTWETWWTAAIVSSLWGTFWTVLGTGFLCRSTAQHITRFLCPHSIPHLLFPLLYFNGTYNTKLLYLVSFGSGSANQSVRYCLAAARTLTCTVGYEY
jgi:hypothetical protein